MDWFKTLETAQVLEQGAVAIEVDGLRIALWAIDGEVMPQAISAPMLSPF